MLVLSFDWDAEQLRHDAVEARDLSRYSIHCLAELRVSAIALDFASRQSIDRCCDVVNAFFDACNDRIDLGHGSPEAWIQSPTERPSGSGANTRLRGLCHRTG